MGDFFVPHAAAQANANDEDSGACLLHRGPGGIGQERMPVDQQLLAHREEPCLAQEGAVGGGEILLHIMLGGDDDGGPGGLVREQIRSVSETSEVVLPEEHSWFLQVTGMPAEPRSVADIGHGGGDFRLLLRSERQQGDPGRATIVAVQVACVLQAGDSILAGH